MLIQKPLTRNDVVTLKLLTGEEVIAEYDSEDEHVVKVSKPSVVAANGEGMGLIPWVMSSMPKLISINKKTIIAYMPTDEAIAKKFTSLTSSIARV